MKHIALKVDNELSRIDFYDLWCNCPKKDVFDQQKWSYVVIQNAGCLRLLCLSQCVVSMVNILPYLDRKNSTEEINGFMVYSLKWYTTLSLPFLDSTQVLWLHIPANETGECMPKEKWRKQQKLLVSSMAFMINKWGNVVNLKHWAIEISNQISFPFYD